jgi:beta-N-acetylhexosaminidase
VPAELPITPQPAPPLRFAAPPPEVGTHVEAGPDEAVKPARSRRNLLHSKGLQGLIAIVVVGLLAVAGFYLADGGRTPAAARPATRPRATPSVPDVAPLPPGCTDTQSLLAGMQVRDRLAQLLMVGVTGADDARTVVDTQHVGGIMIGSWTDRTMMGDPLKQIANASGPLPLSVSVDEEGGRVERLASIIGVQDSPRVLAQTQTPDAVHEIALKRGLAMKQLGITVDFAPVVDVTTEADDEVIGDRSFGSDPDTVIKYAGAYAQGLRDAGLLPVLKHFPGHGHGSGDSHLGDVTTPALPELQASDLVPYRTLTAEAPVAVMVGHLEVPGLTTDEPTSLTPAAYALLRSGNYGGPPFDGLVFTDDLSSMKAISDHFGVAQAALKALQAGADIALWVTTDEVPAVLDGLEAAVNAKQLDMNEIDASVLKVAAIKGKSSHCGG